MLTLFQISAVPPGHAVAVLVSQRQGFEKDIRVAFETRRQYEKAGLPQRRRIIRQTWEILSA